MNIYVGNLPFSVTDVELKKMFESFGQVASANVIKDHFSGRSRGFGFVEMPSKEEAEAAIGSLHNKDMGGRPLNVNEARPRPERQGSRGEGRGRY